jgi:hypothetical protein
MLNNILVLKIGIAFLVCVAPIAFYFCWLSTVHRKKHPTVVNGVWDTLSVVLSCVGFLVVGGLVLLGLLQNDPRLLLLGTFQELVGVWERQWLAWLVSLIGYLLLIAAGVLLTLRGRATSMSVYHITSDQLVTSITKVFDQLNWEVSGRIGDTWKSTHGIVTLQSADGMRHSTVQIQSSPTEQQAFFRVLRQELETVDSTDGPVQGWCTTTALSLVLSMTFVVALMCYFLYFR